MSRRPVAWPVLAFLACATACFAADEKSAAHAGHRAGHGTGGTASAKALTGVVSLDVYADGPRLHMLLGERRTAGEPPALTYTRSEDGGATWSTPAPVGTGQPTPDPIKRGTDAQIVAAGGRLLAVWTIGANTKMGRGPLAAAASGDGGKTWSPAPTPSDADAKAVIDHAFVDLASDESGNVHAVWLDARPTSSAAGGADAGPTASAGAAPTLASAPTQADAPASGKGSGSGSGAGKGLRYARSSDGGRTWSPNVTLDAQCCECCWNSLLVLPGGAVHVLYRDRDPRDMALVSSTDGGRSWGAAAPVGAFHWDFTGCPHVGGALAAGGPDGRDLFAVVWTAKGEGALGAFALSSHDAGKSWSTPAQLGGTQSSRPDVATAPGGKRAVAVWDAYVDGAGEAGNAIFAAESADGGRTWAFPVRLSDPSASATHARVVRTKDGFRVFWTQKAAGQPAAWTSRELK